MADIKQIQENKIPQDSSLIADSVILQGDLKRGDLQKFYLDKDKIVFTSEKFDKKGFTASQTSYLPPDDGTTTTEWKAALLKDAGWATQERMMILPKTGMTETMKWKPHPDTKLPVLVEHGKWRDTGQQKGEVKKWNMSDDGNTVELVAINRFQDGVKEGLQRERESEDDDFDRTYYSSGERLKGKAERRAMKNDSKPVGKPRTNRILGYLGWHSLMSEEARFKKFTGDTVVLLAQGDRADAKKELRDTERAIVEADSDLAHKQRSQNLERKAAAQEIANSRRDSKANAALSNANAKALRSGGGGGGSPGRGGMSVKKGLLLTGAAALLAWGGYQAWGKKAARAHYGSKGELALQPTKSADGTINPQGTFTLSDAGMTVPLQIVDAGNTLEDVGTDSLDQVMVIYDDNLYSVTDYEDALAEDNRTLWEDITYKSENSGNVAEEVIENAGEHRRMPVQDVSTVEAPHLRTFKFAYGDSLVTETGVKVALDKNKQDVITPIDPSEPIFLRLKKSSIEMLSPSYDHLGERMATHLAGVHHHHLR